MYLVCENNPKFEETSQLIAAANRLGIEVSNAPWDEYCHYLGLQPYFLYGTRPFVLSWIWDEKHILNNMEYLYDYSFLLSIPNKALPLFNPQAKLAPAGQIKPQIDDDEYLSYYRRDGIFVRPNDGNKAFTGTVIKYEELDKIQYLFNINTWHVCVYDIAKTPLDEEYRFFIKRDDNDKINMIGCRYWPNSSNDIPSEISTKAKEYAKYIFDKMTVGNCFVLDVGRYLSDKGNPRNNFYNKPIYIVEINSWNSSTFYSIDPESILKMVFNL